MVTKNPEALRHPEDPRETKQELKTLKLNVSKDYERFETLSKDPTLKKGLNKLFDKSCKQAFSEEWKHYEKLNVGKTIENILKKYPDLRFEISGKLGLPLSERKFSNLSLQQKLNFTALHKSIFGKNILYKNNPSSKDIIARINSNEQKLFDKINNQFKWGNINNFLDLEKTLKDYGLTQTEIGKLKEYLLIIKKHPEFIYGKNTTLEANFWETAKMIGILLTYIAVFLLGIWGKTRIDNLGKIEPEETTIIEGVTTINDPEAVLKLVTSEVDWSINGRKELKPKAEGFFYSMLNSNTITRTILLNPYMDAQTKEILMNLEGRSAMQFDLKKGSRIDIYAKDGKGEIYVQLPFPDIVTVKTEAHITKVDRELVHVKEYDKGQEDLRQELEKQAIEDLKKSKAFYENGKNDVTKQLFDLFSTMYAPVGLKITGVHVKFINPDEGPKNFIDPEGRTIINFE